MQTLLYQSRRLVEEKGYTNCAYSPSLQTSADYIEKEVKAEMV
jgi:hypothetical protein